MAADAGKIVQGAAKASPTAASRGAAKFAAAARLFADPLKILGSNLAVNISSFAVLAAASRWLSIAEFAELSLIIAASQMLASVLDLGTNFGVVRMYGHTHDRRYLSMFIWMKIAVTLAGLALCAVAVTLQITWTWVCILICAAAANLWAGARTLEQAQQEYHSFATSSALFAGFRAVLGLAGIVSGSAKLTALAFFVAPVLAVALQEQRKVATLIARFDAGAAKSVLGYAMPAYASSVFYNIFIYYPQFVISHRHDATAAAMFGVLLTFLGPIALLQASVRLYLLPRVSGNEIKRGAILRNSRSVTLLVALTVSGLAAIALGTYVIGHFYEARFPGLSRLLWLYLSAFYVTSIVGLLNLDIHRLGRTGTEAMVNAGRLAALVVLLAAFGRSLEAIVMITLAIMVAGEFILFLLVGHFGAKENAAAMSQEVTSEDDDAVPPSVSTKPLRLRVDTETGESSAATLKGCGQPGDQSPAARVRCAVLCTSKPLAGWQQAIIDNLLARDTVTLAGTIVATGSGRDVQYPEMVLQLTVGALTSLRAMDLDFIVLFGAERCAAPVQAAARHGVWTFAGLVPVAGYTPAAFWPVLDGAPKTTISLVRLGDEPGRDIVLKRGSIRTSRTYPTNLAGILAAITEWPAAAAATLQAGYDCDPETLGEAGWTDATRVPPSNARLRLALTGIARLPRRILGYLNNYDVWNIGFARCDFGTLLAEGVPAEVDWAPAPGLAQYAADPMVLETTSGIQVLYEHFDYWRSKGYFMSRRYAPATGWAPAAVPFIEEPFHLSYPIVVTISGAPVCIPESIEAGVCYRYTLNAEGKPTGERAIFADFPIADPTLVQHEGRWYLFGAGAGENQHMLRIWFAATQLGPWTPHPANPVKCDIATARSAGPFIRHEGKLYRPSQNSTTFYGCAANIMQVLELSPTAFREVLVRELRPHSTWRYTEGLHTISMMDGGVFIDAKAVSRSSIAPIVRIVNFIQGRRRKRARATPAAGIAGLPQ